MSTATAQTVRTQHRCEGREPFEATVGVLRAVTEQSASESPERITGKTDRHQDQEHLAERLLGDRLQGAALVCRLAAGPDCKLDGQDADHAVDDAARNESRSRERLEALCVFDLVTGSFGASDGWRLSAHSTTTTAGSCELRPGSQLEPSDARVEAIGKRLSVLGDAVLSATFAAVSAAAPKRRIRPPKAIAQTANQAQPSERPATTSVSQCTSSRTRVAATPTAIPRRGR